ncbi:Divergent polysaccharide deacetylase [Marinomonas spartinae]|uniref:divergent polysaccharide deacetylase family protein n=1 Tax=Marinomonas spartinae TaxID=1792290 RepID=UPI000808BD17|nr:divergent polysaccharide deacetylase family protein [Marinomonas spartinae]SBS40338.1 Divergent polysaccharide deacetylase [Marinomonas spartinae]
MKVVLIKRMMRLFVMLYLGLITCVSFAHESHPVSYHAQASKESASFLALTSWLSSLTGPLKSMPVSSVEESGFMMFDALNPEQQDDNRPLMLQTIDDRVVDRQKSKSPTNGPSLLGRKVRIAILIDDLGYNRRGMLGALQLPKEVALAILPMTPFAHQTAVRSKEQGRLTMLHAPMENERELKLGPGGLYARMSEKELKAALTKDIDSLPGIQGVNNHMGSLLTANQKSMNWVMQTLKQHHLFFIDSLTSSHSVAGKTAKKYGLKTTTRDVFLDNIRTEKAIDRQFSHLIKVAKHRGEAMAIGHPYPETLSYLKKRLTQLNKDGVVLVPLSQILSHNAPSL